MHNNNNKNIGNVKDEAIYATPTKNKWGNPNNITTDPILKVEHCLKSKIQDHCKNPGTTPTTKAAHNKFLRDIANKSNLTAVTEVIKDYAKDSEVYENCQDALSHIVELRKSRVWT